MDYSKPLCCGCFASDRVLQGKIEALGGSVENKVAKDTLALVSDAGKWRIKVSGGVWGVLTDQGYWYDWLPGRGLHCLLLSPTVS